MTKKQPTKRGFTWGRVKVVAMFFPIVVFVASLVWVIKASYPFPYILIMLVFLVLYTNLLRRAIRSGSMQKAWRY